MIKVAFLGSDSTHTEAFAKQLNLPGGQYHGKAEVVSIWGEDDKQTRGKADALKIPRVCKTAAEALEGVDLAMVIGRFGNSHFAPTMAALERGLPTFVDKPFTLSLKESEQLAAAAERKKARLFSSSPLRFAKELDQLVGPSALKPSFVSVAAPANCTDLGKDPRFDSVFFYGIHAVEVLLQVVRQPVRKLTVATSKRSIETHVTFDDVNATVHFIRDADEFYEINAYTKDQQIHRTIALDGSYYRNLLKFIFEDFYEGKDTIPLSNTLAAISILEATEKADLAR